MSPYSTSAAGFHASAARMVRSMGVSTLGAVTPTNRTVAPGPARQRKAAATVSVGDREGGVQAGDLEHLAGRRLEPPELDAAPALPGSLQRADEDPEPGRVDEVHPREVDDDTARAPFDEPVQLVAQSRGRGDVHLALDDDGRRAGVVTYRDPEVFARGLIRAGGDHAANNTQALRPASQLEPDGGAAVVRVVTPPIGERVDDLEPAAVDPISVDRTQLGPASADVAHFDADAHAVEADQDAGLGARVPIGVRDELARQKEDQLDEVVGTVPAPECRGDESARAGGARRHRWKDGRHLVRDGAASTGTRAGTTDRLAHALASARSRSRLRLSSRDTCIWLTPTRSAISDCVRLSKKRSSTMRRSRSGRALRSSSISDRCSIRSNAGSSSPRHEASSPPSSSGVTDPSSETSR